MKYIRKGGSGKSGTLREQFNYYKRQMRKRLIQEQAFKEAMGVGTIEPRIQTFFKNLQYEEVFKKGITRNFEGKTTRFVGNEAVKIQIQSLRERSGRSFQVENFIKNYVYGMKQVDFGDENINKIERMLQSCSIDKLTFLIEKGILPSIQYIYAELETEEEFVEEVRDAVTKGVTRNELRELKEKQRSLIGVITQKSIIMGW